MIARPRAQADSSSQNIENIIERLGSAFEEGGSMPRISGRIFALLLLEEGPFSFDDLASRLKISRASISTNTRLLRERGAIERVSVLGDRRDFFQLAEKPFMRMVEASIARLEETARIAENAEHSLPLDKAYARHNLAQAAEIHRAVVSAFATLLEATT